MNKATLTALLSLLWLLCSPSQAGISGAMTGAWYEPARAGSGFMVEVLPDDRAVLYWFTYDEGGRQQWFFGVGQTTDDAIVIDELKRGSGGRFGPDFDPDDVILPTIGTLRMTFSSCGDAIADYTVDGVSDSQSLIRLVGVDGFSCTAVGASDQAEPYFNQTASWYAAGRSGEGFIVQVYAEDQAFIIWFTYDDVGNPAWYTGIAFVAAQSVVIGELQLTSGGRFSADHDPDAVVRERAGRLELFLECNSGRVYYDMDDGKGPSGGHDITRLTEIAGLPCEQSLFSTPEPEELVGLWQSEGFGVAADVTAEQFTLFEVTEVSCLVVGEGPLPALASAIEGVGLDQSGNRLELLGLDSVTPVYLTRVENLPPTCADGGTAPTTDPIHNYDVFAATYDELYAVFAERGVDWAQQQLTYGPQVTASTSQDDLFDVFSDMLAPLNDLHTTIRSATRFFGSGTTPQNQAYFQRAQSGDTDVIIRSYIDGVRFGASGGLLNYGLLGQGIGYLEAKSFTVIAGGDDPGSRLQAYRDELDGIFQFFADNDVDRLVLDVRRNEGGNGVFGYEIANRLLRGETRIMFSERRPQAGGLGSAYAATLVPGEGLSFDGEVVLLTGRITGSAAENFTFAIRALPHSVTIGEPTAGVLSRTERILPNGWIASLTAGQILSPEGDLYEAIGIPPDMNVPVFADADYAAGRDSALEAVLEMFAASSR